MSMLPSTVVMSSDFQIPEKEEDLKDLMPTERKSTWRSVDERRMSDLTRVLEWLERRRSKKKSVTQKLNEAGPSKVKVKEEPKTSKKKGKSNNVVQKGKLLQISLYGQKEDESNFRKEEESIAGRKYSRTDGRGKQFYLSSYSREGTSRRSEADIKDTMLGADGSQRPYRRQSLGEPSLQEIFYINRRSTLLKEWAGKTSENVYERKLKSLMEKGQEPKIDSSRMLKPDEVLSCRYLRLSVNNIKTLLKLCKDAGMEVDIHPHMVEAEIDTKKVFPGTANSTL